MDTPVTYSTTPKAHDTIAALWRLEKIILDTLDFKDVVQRIVESMLSELGYLNLGYRVIVLALLNEKTQTLQRISFSRTKEGVQAIGSLPLPFEQINIPLSATDNLCVKALIEQHPQITHDVTDVFYPAFTQAEIAPIQAATGIKTTMVYPVLSRGKPMGVLIFSLIKSEQEVSQEEKDLLAGFTDVVGLAVQNSLLYSAAEKSREELQQANDRLKILDKLKDEFVSLASHELRTPMTAIKSYIYLLLQENAEIGPLTPKQQSYLKNTYASTERLIKLVNDMLNVSRIESGRMLITPKPVAMMDIVQEVFIEIQPTAEQQRLTLVLLPALSPPPPVLADADKIKQVLMNLLGNALKFTPPGGSITVSVIQQENRELIRVQDTGKGIKPEDMPKLFKKFGMIEGNYLKTTPGQGTGLGLYIAKSIIELHGGSIRITSDGEDKGTVCTFSLPVAK